MHSGLAPPSNQKVALVFVNFFLLALEKHRGLEGHTVASQACRTIENVVALIAFQLNYCSVGTVALNVLRECVEAGIPSGPE